MLILMLTPSPTPELAFEVQRWSSCTPRWPTRSILVALQVYASPFKRPGDNYFAVCANVLLIFVFSSCIILEIDEVIEMIEVDLTPALSDRYRVNAGMAAAMLIITSLTVLAALLAIFLHSLATVRQRNRRGTHRTRPAAAIRDMRHTG